MTELTFDGRWLNLSDLTIGAQIAEQASKFKEEFKPEFIDQIVELGEIFDTCILNGKIEWAQQIRDAYAIGAQLQQNPATPANTIWIEILKIMNKVLRDLQIDAEQKVQPKILAYHDTMTSLLKAKP